MLSSILRGLRAKALLVLFVISRALFAISPVYLINTQKTNPYSQALNPGNFVTNLQQNMPKMQLAMFVSQHRPSPSSPPTFPQLGLIRKTWKAKTG